MDIFPSSDKNKIESIFQYAFKRPLDKTGNYGLVDWLNIKKFTPSQFQADLQDKLKVKQYIKNKCPGLRTAEVFWYGDYIVNAWNELPQKFMLKANHGKDFNLLVDKDKTGIAQAQKAIDKWLKTDFGAITEERAYSLIKPIAFAEEFLENKDHESGLPEDYKFWTFHGTPGFLQINMEGKWTGESFDDRRIECFDPYTGERLPQRYGFHLLAENPYEKINIPNDMIKYAKLLAENLDFVRVDFYLVNNKIYFGELTFTPGCAYIPIYPLALETIWANVVNKRMTVDKALQVVKQYKFDHPELADDFVPYLSEEQIRNFIKV